MNRAPAPIPADPATKPNFLLIVVLSAIVLLIGMVAVVFFLHARATKLVPHGPNPTPNSRVAPMRAAPDFIQIA